MTSSRQLSGIVQFPVGGFFPQAYEIAVLLIALQKLIMGTFGYSAVIDHNDLIGIPDGLKSVSDHDNGFVFRCGVGYSSLCTKL